MNDIVLWDHQQRGCDELIKLISSNIGKKVKHHPCLTSPTGGGKSRMMVWLMNKLQHELGMSTSFLVNRKTLVDQFASTCESFGLNYGVIASQRKEVGYDKPHVVCASDTLISRCITRKSMELPVSDVVFVDEAHLQKNGGKFELIEMFKARGSTVIGMTATPLGISHVYDDLIVAGTNSELRKCGAHLPCFVYGPDEPDMKHIKRLPTGEFCVKDTAKWVYQIFGRVFDYYQILNPEMKPTILFAPGVAESVWFMEQFNQAGVSAVSIDGSNIVAWEHGRSTRLASDPVTRKQVFDDVQSGKIKVVCNRFVMREGIDIPGLYHAILATPIGSTTSYVQTVGRILRNCESLKDVGHVVIQDHGGNWWRHGSPNMDRDWQSVFEMKESFVADHRADRCAEGKEPEPICCPNCQAIRMYGPKCHSCGFEHRASVRMVWQVNGTLKEVTSKCFPKKNRKDNDDVRNRWRQMVISSQRSRSKNGMTFKQAEALFFLEFGHYPSRQIPYMPIDELDMGRKIRDVEKKDLITEKAMNAIF